MTKSTFWQSIRKYKFLHIAAWLLIIINNLILYYETARPLWGNIIDIVYMVFINGAVPFYFCAYYLTPNFLYTKKYLKLALIIFLVTMNMTINYLIYTLLDIYIFYPENFLSTVSDFEFYLHFFLITSWTYFIPCLLSISLKVMSDKFKVEKQYQLSHEAKINSELNFLKAQINPHFLFNVMNTIYFMISKTNAKARDHVVLISEMLRYQLYESKDNWVHVEMEIEFLQNYIHIWRLREKKGDVIELFIDPNIKGFDIPSMLFQPILEQLFLHALSDDVVSSQVKIDVKRTNGKVLVAQFFCKNKLKNTTYLTDNVEISVLNNLKRRLKLIYNDDFLLTTSIKDDTTSIELSLNYGKDQLYNR